MSVPDLARDAGVTQRVIERLEDGGAIDGGDEAISISTLRVVARALGLEMAKLFTHQEADETSAKNVRADAALIGNILERVGEPVSHSQIATALAWDGARVDHAVAVLPEALAAAGLSLRMVPEGMTTAPTSDTSAQAAAAEIKRRAVDDNHYALRVIWKSWQAGREFLKLDALSATERDLARGLVASHVLDVNASGDLSVHRSIYRDLAPAIPLQVPFHPGEY